MPRLSLPLGLIALAASPAFAQEAPAPAPTPTLSAAQKNAIAHAELPADQAALKSHVLFLASDALKGREAGTAEFDIAANYVAAQFYAAGLRPAGDEGGFLQKVPLVSYKLDGQGTMSVVGKRGAPVALEYGKDFVSAANPETASYSVTAPVVFVGYGIVGQGRDDYRGADVKGKIVAYFAGAPADFPSEISAHFSNAGSKAEIAAKRGAIGFLTIEAPRPGQARPFSYYVTSAPRARVGWAEANGVGHISAPGTPSVGTLSLAGAEKLFAGARRSWADVSKAAMAPSAKFKAEVLPVTLSVTSKTVLTTMTSYNVAGMLPGSDPVIGSQVVVLSGHLDHIGITAPDAKGDTINNGALDDAIGIASLIEEAKRFKTAGTRPRRSILFLAVTAEEKGLIGSDYFANHPTVPGKNIVADVNLDMPIITYKFQDVVVYGAGHSTLGAIVNRATQAVGVPQSEDPLPGENIFVRSDHYNFVRKGVPSVFLWPGAGGPGRAAIDYFMKNHYHQPSDEIGQQPALDWESGVRFVDLNYRIAREIADSDARPVWNKGDFFGLAYDGPGAK